MSINNITGIVIAGGKSTRMGQNKALIPYGDTRFIDNAINILKPFVQNILVSSNEPINDIIYPIVKDEIKDIGPISGLYTCLKQSNTEINLVIPCDTPHVNPKLYQSILENLEGNDVIVPTHSDGRIEPLMGCYKKSIVSIIEHAIHSKDYKLLNLLKRLRTYLVPIDDIAQFRNINTPTDLL